MIIPDLREGRCLPDGSTLHPDAWISGDPGQQQLAVAECLRCPCLRECRVYHASLSRRQRPTGIVAGVWLSPPSHRRPEKPREYVAGPDGALLEAAWDDEPPVLTVAAGLASAVAQAGDSGLRRNGRDLAKRRQSNIAYRESHREKIAAHKRQRYPEVRDDWNARKREKRRLDLDAVRAAERARYRERRDEIVARRRERRQAAVV